jgi:hypothetical protein
MDRTGPTLYMACGQSYTDVGVLIPGCPSPSSTATYLMKEFIGEWLPRTETNCSQREETPCALFTAEIFKVRSLTSNIFVIQKVLEM